MLRGACQSGVEIRLKLALTVFGPREGMRLGFRGEFYNLTNSPRFGNPVNNVNAGNFGQITGTLFGEGERDIQFALRLTF